jgi:glucose-6-phosphate isomerase, archaeal
MSSTQSRGPFFTSVEAQRLEIRPKTGGYTKYIRELDGIYADQSSFQAIVKTSGDSVAYQVDEIRFSDKGSDLITGLSGLQPGKVGSEFFMTRGHLHKRADRAETYYCLAGHGILLMESLEGKSEAAEMRPGSLVYVPPFWVHRSVNVGSDIFATLFSYPADAGQDFDIVKRAGGFRQIVVDDGKGGWKLERNSRYQPRTAAEIEEFAGPRE